MHAWLTIVVLLVTPPIALAEQQFGLAGNQSSAVQDSDGACVRLSHSLTTFPLAVRIVFPGDSTAVKGRLVSKLAAPCRALQDSDSNEGESYYKLRLDQGNDDNWFGIAEIGDPLPFSHFHTCTSMEGLHFTVWAGTPLHSPMLWHSYAYLGYDVESDCKDEEISEPDL